jgi:hypothetical protein
MEEAGATGAGSSSADGVLALGVAVVVGLGPTLGRSEGGGSGLPSSLLPSTPLSKGPTTTFNFLSAPRNPVGNTVLLCWLRRDPTAPVKDEPI